MYIELLKVQMEDEHFIELFINTVNNNLCITHFANNGIHKKSCFSLMVLSMTFLKE